jgi:hypothetical protein
MGNEPDDKTPASREPDRDAVQPDSAQCVDQSIIRAAGDKSTKIKEIGGPSGLEPTRYGDWESKGRCIDF